MLSFLALTVAEKEERNTSEGIKLLEERGEILKQNLDLKSQLACAESKIVQKQDVITQQETKLSEKDNMVQMLTKQRVDSNALNESTKQILHD